MTQDKEYRDFGFRRVDAQEKSGLVGKVFDRVSDRYDLMNDLMSGGLHRVWKSVLYNRVELRPGQSILDVAGGTGDIANGLLNRVDEYAAIRDETEGANPDYKSACAVICDINEAMLVAGKSRGDHPNAVRICGNAEALPIGDRQFDRYTIGFGIRNVTNIDKALEEAYRVLGRGGRFFCLEFSQPILESLQTVYDEYSFQVIPWLGKQVVNDRDSYQYLVESIRKFPNQQAFAAMVEKAGFSQVKFENLSGGIAAIHSGWRL